MLDIAAIKSAPRASDAPSQDSKKPVQRDTRDDAKQEFQSEYESTAEDAHSTDEGRMTKPEESKSSQPNDRSTEDNGTELEEPKFSADTEAGEFDDKNLKSAASASVTDEGSPEKNTALVDIPAETVSKKEVAGATTVTALEERALASKADASKPTKELSEPKTTPAGKTAAESIVLSKAVDNVAPATAKPARETSVLEGRMASQPADTASKPTSGNTAAITLEKAANPRTELGENQKRAELVSRDIGAIAKEQKAPPVFTAPQLKPTTPTNQMHTRLEAVGDKLDAGLTISSDLDGLASTEARSSGSATSTNLGQILNRAETPGMIARQMAEALQKLPDRPVEISLNPKELGRVRMNISAAEAGITVNIVAERPETLDLMRRNIEQLAREFQAIGYESIDFAFSEGEANQSFSDEQASEGGSEISQLELISEDDQPDEAQPQMTVSTGVDIRI